MPALADHGRSRCCEASEGYKSRVYITKGAVDRIIHLETEALSPFAFVDAYGSENRTFFAYSIILGLGFSDGQEIIILIVETVHMAKKK